MTQKTTLSLLLALGLVVVAGILIYLATRGSITPLPNEPAPAEVLANENTVPATQPVTPATNVILVVKITPPPVATTQPGVMPLLEDPMLKRLWIEEGSEYTLEDGLLTVHKPSGQMHGFHAQIGGPHLDNYRASLEFHVVDGGRTELDGRKGMGANVQIAPNDSDIFCQMLCRPGYTKVAYMDGHKFRDVKGGPAQLNPGWNSMAVEVSEGSATISINGIETCTGRVPIGTAGPLGLLVNFASDAKVEIRSFELELLKATPEQMKELETKAKPGKTVE